MSFERLPEGVRSQLQLPHGCIHISPFDRDRFLRAGAFARGVDLLIHTYEESMPNAWS